MQHDFAKEHPGHRADGRLVPHEGVQLLAAVGIPVARGAVLVNDLTADDQDLIVLVFVVARPGEDMPPIGGEGDGVDVGGVSLEFPLTFTGGNIEGAESFLAGGEQALAVG